MLPRTFASDEIPFCGFPRRHIALNRWATILVLHRTDRANRWILVGCIEAHRLFSILSTSIVIVLLLVFFDGDSKPIALG